MLTYQKIIKDGKKTYLFAEELFNEKTAQINRLQVAYNELRALLTAGKYPAEEVWIKAVAERGAQGLEKVLRESVYAEIKRLKIPSYMSQMYLTAAHDQVTAETWKRADELSAQIREEADGLPLETGDISVTDTGVFVDADAIAARVRLGCCLEVTAQMEADAAQIAELAAAVRCLELAGVNALELVKKYVDAFHFCQYV